jgi:hypothetical protein
MAEILKEYIYLIIGVIVIVLAIIFSRRLGDKEVNIDWPKIGFNLKADRLTVFYLMGFALILAGVFFKFKGYETRLSVLENNLKDKETVADLSNRLGEYEIKLSLEFDSSITADPRELKYWVRGKINGKDNIERSLDAQYQEISGLPYFNLEHIKNGDKFQIVAQKSNAERWITEIIEIPKTTVKLKR